MKPHRGILPDWEEHDPAEDALAPALGIIAAVAAVGLLVLVIAIVWHLAAWVL